MSHDFSVLKKIRTLTDAELADIALWFATQYPETFAERVGTIGSPGEYTYSVPGTFRLITLTPYQVERIRWAGNQAGGKIRAIAALRTIVDLGLKEAKDLVERQEWFKDEPRY